MTNHVVKIRICACCDDDAIILMRRISPLEGEDLMQTLGTDLSYLPEPTRTGLIDIVTHDPTNLGMEGKVLIKMCLHFLLYQRQFREEHNTIAPSTIWSFICSYLGVKRNSGYDYFIMCYLDHFDFMEHGCGIRCGWLLVDERSSDKWKKFVCSIINKTSIENTARYNENVENVLKPWLASVKNKLIN